jgi:serine O-acetyltransferase
MLSSNLRLISIEPVWNQSGILMPEEYSKFGSIFLNCGRGAFAINPASLRIEGKPVTATVEILNFSKSNDTGFDLQELVLAFRHSREHSHNIRHNGQVRELPSRSTVSAIVDGLTAAMFPTHFGPTIHTDENIDFFVGSSLNAAFLQLTEQVRRSLHFDLPENEATGNLKQRAKNITVNFVKTLPAMRAVLVSDLQAAYRGDPAATSYSEILLCYRGMAAIIHYRLAHALHQLGVRLLARLIADVAHAATGMDIHPGAEISENFFIDHGTGVVIGKTVIIGKNVRLYQAVTLGAVRFPAEENGTLMKGTPRHPIIEDNVVIYAGATILGRVTVGQGSVIGGNVWLTHSVPPGSTVSQARNQNS